MVNWAGALTVHPTFRRTGGSRCPSETYEITSLPEDAGREDDMAPTELVQGHTYLRLTFSVERLCGGPIGPRVRQLEFVTVN